MPIPFEILQVTAAYSNAVLIAIMPHISDFAKKLDLPISQPVTIQQVRHFGCSSRSDHVGGRVVLTNDFSFTFDVGTVVLYRSPKSYYSLQDPERIPEFYGPVKVSEKEAVKVARDALKKLGYSESELHYDLPPKTKLPVKNQGHEVARYLFQWRDPNMPDTGKYGVEFTTANVEVDATTSQIQMLGIPTRNAPRPDPKIDVHPPVLVPAPKSQPVGGIQMYHVGKAYENAFMKAILPQVTDFIKKAELDVKTPITTNDVDMSHYECWWESSEGILVVIYLKNADRFIYCHGQVTAFDAADANRWIAPNSPMEDKPPERFFGPINISSNEALTAVRKAINNLGWPTQVPALKKRPDIVLPRKIGTNYLAHYFFNWWPDDGSAQIAVAEVNATTKRIVSISVSDRNYPKLWRDPPKIDVPMEIQMADQNEQSPSTHSNVPVPTPNVPPGVPLPPIKNDP